MESQVDKKIDKLIDTLLLLKEKNTKVGILNVQRTQIYDVLHTLDEKLHIVFKEAGVAVDSDGNCSVTVQQKYTEFSLQKIDLDIVEDAEDQNAVTETDSYEGEENYGTSQCNVDLPESGGNTGSSDKNSLKQENKLQKGGFMLRISETKEAAIVENKEGAATGKKDGGCNGTLGGMQKSAWENPEIHNTRAKLKEVVLNSAKLESIEESKKKLHTTIALSSSKKQSKRTTRKSKNIPQCTLCNKNFSSNRNLQNHHRKIHSGIPRLKCSLCQNFFSSEHDFQEHGRKCSKEHKCDICNKVFEKRCHLTRHKQSHMNSILRPFVCTICDKDFTTKSWLNLHIKRHSKDRPYACGICNKTFASESDRRKHSKYHSKDIVQCEVCKKVFNHKKTLYNHMLRHNDIRPHMCEKCGKSFHTKTALTMHDRTHTGYRPFSCSTCGKCFSKNTNLKLHMTIHTGEKSKQCTICGKTFSRGYNLNTHLQTHSTERPFKCEYCPKSFLRKKRKEEHIERYHSDVERDEGNKYEEEYTEGKMRPLVLFSHDGQMMKDAVATIALQDSMLEVQASEEIHSTERPYKCEYCPSSFSRKKRREEHIEEYHKNKGEVIIEQSHTDKLKTVQHVVPSIVLYSSDSYGKVEDGTVVISLPDNNWEIKTS